MTAKPSATATLTGAPNAATHHVPEQKESSIPSQDLYLKSVQEMYPDQNLGWFSSNMVFNEDWVKVRATAALRALTSVKDMISPKKLVYMTYDDDDDNDYDFDEICASTVQKKAKNELG